ncbi:MAG: hypothetical protein LH606_11915 [Cytophagaceae bacterium]|nr:hypothetical protein [Cytophagaceae bacterium]
MVKSTENFFEKENPAIFVQQDSLFQNLMAGNTGKNTRVGAVRKRTQVYNPQTGHYIKRDAETGQFMEVKRDGTPFKGVTVEKSIIKAHPAVSKTLAAKAERAVLSLNRKKAR